MQFTNSSLPKILALGVKLSNPSIVEVVESSELIPISEIIELNPDLIAIGKDVSIEQFISSSYLIFRYNLVQVDKDCPADSLYDYAMIPKYQKGLRMISLFTSAYNSGYKIQRAYESLLNQTWKCWEWVIVDDSPNDETWNIIKNIASIDPRVRIYKFDSPTKGCIGEAKYRASMLCNGLISVEFDHDDVLTYDALELIWNAYDTYPECGFYYSDCVEYNFNTKESYTYPEPFGLGYCHHYRTTYNRVDYIPATGPSLNPKTIHHIVSVPNHVRAWKTSVLKSIQYNRAMRIADDYELIVRTFLNTEFCYIPRMLYIQSMGDGNSQDFSKNRADIQRRVKFISDMYSERISKRFKDYYGIDDPVAGLSHREIIDYPNEKIPGPFNKTLIL